MKNAIPPRPLPCMGCAHDLSRRGFLRQCGWMTAAGAGLAMGGLHPLHAASQAESESAAQKPGRKVRVGTLFVCAPQDWNVWPYVNFDYETRKTQLRQALGRSCPDLEFVPLTVEGNPDEEISKANKLAQEVDGFLVFLLCTNWGLTHRLLPALAELKKPLVLVDELYAGSGVTLCHGAMVLRKKAKAVVLSTGRFQDVAEVTRCFELLARPETTLDSFTAEAERVRVGNFARPGDLTCKVDPVRVAEVKEVIQRLQASKILRVDAKKGNPFKAMGTTVEPVSFDEINAAYLEADKEEAKVWADQWIKEAREVVEPSREDIEKAAAIYLAMKNLLAERGAQGITINCLGGFYSGKLPGYPCLGYRQLNDDGVTAGTCEAQLPDMTAMLACRYMFDRASFASDPVLDSSTNQVIYAHCVAPTRVLGAQGLKSPFRIRSHAEDGKGASIQSLLPVDYMTTSFRTTHDYKEMVIHQAKAVANVDDPRACRTKLAAEVKGDMEKLFYQWDRFSWHRLTVYGDVQEPIEALAQALKMKVIREA